MANPEHLKVLEQGVEVWNKWREENPDIRPDLSGMHLPRENFAWIDFSGVNIPYQGKVNRLLRDLKASEE